MAETNREKLLRLITKSHEAAINAAAGKASVAEYTQAAKECRAFVDTLDLDPAPPKGAWAPRKGLDD